MNIAHNMDCMEAMREMRDNEFDLCICDPPYGIGKRLTSGGSGGGWDKLIHSGAEKWDILPPKEYFNLLFKVSANQIIWGGNFFNLPICRSPICWDKVRPNQKNASEWEYAWTSFEGRARLFSYCNNGGFLLTTPRIHPTQKPIALYKWLLKNYAKEGDKILDSHLGSGSSRIACYDMGFDFVGYEIDKDYFNAQEKRFNNHIAQYRLFGSKEQYQ